MKFAATAFAIFALTAQNGLSYEYDRGRQDGLGRSHQLTFNIFCKYTDSLEYLAPQQNRRYSSRQFKKCYAASQFEKDVTRSGKEVEDDSEFPFNPLFEVECDGEMIYNENSRRFTDREGTRIQGESGPYPGILLPKYSLSSGRRQVESRLELRDQTLSGSCHIYTGRP